MLYLWVFWAAWDSYYVINKNTQICWEFIQWTASKNNWVPEWFESVTLVEWLFSRFNATQSCQKWNTSACCKDLWYRYAWVSIGQVIISENRSAAEYLAQKNIIVNHSLDPSNYLLDADISRKELMKIIIQASGIETRDSCKNIFSDVEDDWGCKYIETALSQWIIAWNQEFRPNDSVTQSEALKLVFQSLNIEKRYTTNSWQQDYISSAFYLWFINIKFSDYNLAAKRWYIFSVLEKALKYKSK